MVFIATLGFPEAHAQDLDDIGMRQPRERLDLTRQLGNTFWFRYLHSMVSTIKEGMGGAKSDYLQNHTFKSPVTRTDTRS